jgi:hypothetical protein
MKKSRTTKVTLGIVIGVSIACIMAIVGSSVYKYVSITNKVTEVKKDADKAAVLNPLFIKRYQELKTFMDQYEAQLPKGDQRDQGLKLFVDFSETSQELIRLYERNRWVRQQDPYELTQGQRDSITRSLNTFIKSAESRPPDQDVYQLIKKSGVILGLGEPTK